MNLVFVGSPNHASREGHAITDIVLHWMDGTLAGTDARFAKASEQVSSHYGIEDNTIHQYVAESETAWHCGDKPENQRSIGIEHSADPDRPASAQTIITSVALIVGLCKSYGIDPSHIYGHNKFFATQCPGTLPLGEMVSQVRAQLGGLAPTPLPVIHPTPTPQPTGGFTVRTIDLRNATTTLVTGPGVVPMQLLLRVTPDGLGGRLTRFALTNYQTHVGLKADAIFGPLTASALLAGK